MKGSKKIPTIALVLGHSILTKGGLSILVDEILVGLSEIFNVILISPDKSESLQYYLRERPNILHISFQLKEWVPLRSFRNESNKFIDELNIHKVDLIHFHSSGTYDWGNCLPLPSLPELCRNYGFRVIWTNHLTVLPSKVFSNRRLGNFVGSIMEKLARAGKERQMNAVDLEIAVSKHDFKFLTDNFPHGKKYLTQVYHSRIDQSRQIYCHDRANFILSVGHVAFRKGQQILVEAFLRISDLFPEWELRIVGHDSGDGCYQHIEKLIRSHPQGKNVSMLGARQDTEDLMLYAGIFVQPSLEEALGLALQEALFLGCPSIGSNVGGIPELIDHGLNGFLTAPGDSQELSKTLAELISDENLRKRIGDRGRDSITTKKMTRQAMLESHISIYNNLLKP